MSTLTLVSPNAALADSYKALVAEFMDSGEQLVPFVLGFDHSDFPAFLASLEDCARGLGLPEGFVPHSTFWLVDESGEVLAVSNIRHMLTASLLREGGHIGYGVRPSARGKGYGTALLQHSLAAAAQLGITRALVTCDRNNRASARVILRNGGVLEDEVVSAQRGVVVQRYWIDPVR